MSSTTQLAVLGLVIAVIIPAGLHQGEWCYDTRLGVSAALGRRAASRSDRGMRPRRKILWGHFVRRPLSSASDRRACRASAIVHVCLGVATVQEGHIGVYWRGGALLSSVSDPGFHLKLPFVTSFSEVQVTVQTDYVTGIPW